MKTLYHFTSTHHLGRILRDGLLRTTGLDVAERLRVPSLDNSGTEWA